MARVDHVMVLKVSWLMDTILSLILSLNFLGAFLMAFLNVIQTGNRKFVNLLDSQAKKTRENHRQDEKTKRSAIQRMRKTELRLGQ